MAVSWNSPVIIAKVRRGAAIGVVRGIGIVEKRAVDLLSNPPKTGRIYRRRGVAHQASAPGEAPATDTSRLVNSRKITILDAGLRGRLSFGTKYALPLEVGTIKMQPRPYARRSLAESRSAISSAIHGEIRLALR